MIRTTLPTLLCAALLAGCATAPKGENWAYTGADPALRNPPAMPRGGLTTDEWQLEIQQRMMDWRRKSRDALEESKEACGPQGSTFLACMKSRGWNRVSNPL